MARQKKLPRGLQVLPGRGSKSGKQKWLVKFQLAKHPQSIRREREWTKAEAVEFGLAYWDEYQATGKISDQLEDEIRTLTFRQAGDRYLATKVGIARYKALCRTVQRVSDECGGFTVPGSYRKVTLGELPLVDVSPAVISEAILQIASMECMRPHDKGQIVGWARRRNFCEAIRSIVTFAVDNELLDRSPWKKRHRSEMELHHGEGRRDLLVAKRRLYSEAETRKLTRVVEGVPKRNTVEALVLFASGLRAGEMRALRFGDISAEPPRLVRRKTAHKLGYIMTVAIKGAKRRSIERLMPMHPTLAAALEWWQAAGYAEQYGRTPTAGDLVFPSPEDWRAKMSEYIPTQHLDAIGRKVGVPKLKGRGAHGSRHVLLTRAMEANVSEIMRAGTHGDARRGSILETYTSPQWDPLAAAVLKVCDFGDPDDWKAPERSRKVG